MEGLALNTADKKVYMAISDQSKGMEVNPNDPQDDIRLPKIKSGVTYELDLQARQKDRDENKINSGYVAASMKGIVIGEDMEKSDEYGNTAHPEKVANPDNLSYSDAMKTLFIGEDSGMHTNNYVWAYDTKDEKAFPHSIRASRSRSNRADGSRRSQRIFLYYEQLSASWR